MLQHCLGSGEGQGYHLFFGMKNIETGRQQGLQLINVSIDKGVATAKCAGKTIDASKVVVWER